MKTKLAYLLYFILPYTPLIHLGTQQVEKRHEISYVHTFQTLSMEVLHSVPQTTGDDINQRFSYHPSYPIPIYLEFSNALC